MEELIRELVKRGYGGVAVFPSADGSGFVAGGMTGRARVRAGDVAPTGRGRSPEAAVNALALKILPEPRVLPRDCAGVGEVGA